MTCEKHLKLREKITNFITFFPPTVSICKPQSDSFKYREENLDLWPRQSAPEAADMEENVFKVKTFKKCCATISSTCVKSNLLMWCVKLILGGW